MAALALIAFYLYRETSAGLSYTHVQTCKGCRLCAMKAVACNTNTMSRLPTTNVVLSNLDSKITLKKHYKRVPRLLVDVFLRLNGSNLFFFGQKVLYFMQSTPRNKKSCFTQQITSEAIHPLQKCLFSFLHKCKLAKSKTSSDATDKKKIHW